MANKKLQSYQKKRNFSESPEPKGKVHKTQSKLHFVVQEHDASHLHYDFRLEIGGVLKSWAIPKGPSLNPQDKRLAIETEDHPLEYQDFEGIIPQGHYGAGKVIIWDKGTYEALSDNKSLSEDYQKGHLNFILKGEKLKGKFTLQRIRKEEKSQWLLIKMKDTYAETKHDILEENKSVVSGKTLDEIGEHG